MKKKYLLCCALIIFAPTLYGYVHNRILYTLITVIRVDPNIILLFLFVMPFILHIFWFWVGRKYAHLKMHTFFAIFIGNCVGILSLPLFIWQFFIVSDESRSSFLAGLSQMFASAQFSFITRIVMRIVSYINPYDIVDGVIIMGGTRDLLIIQISGLIQMIIAFSIGIIYEKRKIKNMSATI